jgi:integrase
MSTATKTKVKPPKPYADFPLFPHDSGKWAKKIKGKLIYFGRWDDAPGALLEFEAYAKNAGEHTKKYITESTTLSLNLADACNLFLLAKRDDRDSGHLSDRTYKDYCRTSKRLLAAWGRTRSVSTLSPEDFSAYRAERLLTCNVISTGNEITRVKTILKWLAANKKITPIDTGTDFRKPSSKVVRRHRRTREEMLFTPEQIHLLLDESGIHFKAMLLLGINCAFGNNDINELPLSIVTRAIKTGWIDYPRPKTEVDRRCPLWPETREALSESLKRRPESELKYAFVRANGKQFSESNGDISKRFRAVRQAACIKAGGFYWLRHTFETEAGACKDQVAVNYIMGHVDETMGGVYREMVHDHRLLLAANTVRDWLFA